MLSLSTSRILIISKMFDTIHIDVNVKISAKLYLQQIFFIYTFRGLSLFIGIDLVKDRTTREPNTEIAEHVKSRLVLYSIASQTQLIM